MAKKYLSEIKDLMQEWDWEANADLDPNKLQIGSGKKAWWKCSKCGYKWQAPINKRAISAHRCPCCANRVVVSGINDLATTNPKVLNEWNFAKNKNLTPQMVHKGSHRKVWWICDKGHQYERVIREKVLQNHKCPYCTNKKVQTGINDLATLHPEIIVDWHPTKNGDCKANTLGTSSKKKVWWLCHNCGHEWQTAICYRVHGTGCPQCSFKKRVQGQQKKVNMYNPYTKEIRHFNSVAEAAKFVGHSTAEICVACKKEGRSAAGYYWYYDGNKFIPPNSVPKPYISKPYLITNKELMKEWDWDANVGLDPNKITYGSHKKAWWKCPKCGYRWQQAIMDRTRKKVPARCPGCMNRVAVKGFNDFATFHPDDVKDWHPTKNGDLKPDMITRASSKLIWWKCSKCGHEWQTVASSKRGCPRCLHSATAGKDDLATLRPDLAKEWHPTKNGELKPQDVKLQSNKKVWWLCPNNHEYQAVIGARTRGDNKASNCPICNKQNRTSFPEQAVFYYVKKLYPDAINSYRASFLGLMELDIYIPSLNWAIEYDGAQWHKHDKLKREQQKYQKCIQKKIKLIRVREKMAPLGSDIADEQISIVKLNGIPNLEETIKYIIQRLNFFNKPIDINLGRDEIKIRESYQSKVKDSVANLHPELIKEWHPTKNGFLTPYDCKVGSGYKVWWKCQKCGYEWRASLATRCQKGHGCLNCSKQAPLIGVNDLATLYPEIAKEWLLTKNGDVTPSDIRPMSNRKYWWKCSKCGHEWFASANSRIHLNSGCPACAGRVPRIGSNDLFTACPHLKQEWDFDLNKGIDPITLPIGSHMKVWWRCSKCGHKWQASIRRRTKGSQCPCCCANRVVVTGVNDLATTHPGVVKDWNKEKNGSLTPLMISAGSNKKVWWKCHKCSYEWRASPNHRTANKKPTGCPSCGIKTATAVKVKPVNMIDPKTNKILEKFDSISDAARKLNTSTSIIVRVCQGRGKTALGYIWRYADDQEAKKYQKSKKQLEFDFSK